MNALIGHKLGQQKPAHLHGNILGLTGQGVGGIVLLTETRPEGYVGAFLGKKIILFYLKKMIITLIYISFLKDQNF